MKELNGPITDRLWRLLGAKHKAWTPQRVEEPKRAVPKGVVGKQLGKPGRKKT